MTEQEILELIRQHLSRLMQENPEVRDWIRKLVAQYGITREEWVTFLERFDRLSRGDISEFHRLEQFYGQATGIKPRLIIVSPFVKKRAADLAPLWALPFTKSLKMFRPKETERMSNE